MTGKTVATPTREGRPIPEGSLQTTAVAHVMLTEPAWHKPTTTVEDLRRFFTDDHVHAALIVDQHLLIAIVERGDIGPDAHDGGLARGVGTLRGRTIRDTTEIDTAQHLMNGAGQRRLAVVNADGMCLGLLCLKSSGSGFCSNADVAARRREHGTERA